MENRMKLLKVSLSVAFFGLLLACSSVTVSTDHDKNTDFVNLKTYQWIAETTVTNKSMIKVDAIMDARIRNTINKQLALQGYKEVKGTADLHLNYSVLAEDKTDIRTYQTYGGYSARWGYRGGYGYRGMGGYSDTVVRQYKSGTLVIDFVDPKTNKLIWRGLGSERIPSERNPENMDKLVSEVVESVLKKFPPK